MAWDKVWGAETGCRDSACGPAYTAENLAQDRKQTRGTGVSGSRKVTVSKRKQLSTTLNAAGSPVR